MHVFGGTLLIMDVPGTPKVLPMLLATLAGCQHIRKVA
jgi:hypothetical protein